MNKGVIERINGYGILLRFITPVISGIILAMVGWIHNDITSLKIHFVNHLMHHQDLEVGYERRITENNKKTMENEKDIKKLEACVERLRNGNKETR